MSSEKSIKLILAQNKKAYHDYYIEEKLECGIALTGNEVKSAKAAKVSIKESWVSIKNGELWLKNSYIAKWDTANKFDVDERRDRKLLAHKKEISKFSDKIKLEGMTLVPLSLYVYQGKCKIEIALAKGKHTYDKRAALKEKDIKRALKQV